MSQTGVVSWSQTAASNASADSTVNWAEGQAPSTVNDSARAMMASVAKWRDDISGAIVTGGTSTAYTLSSNQNFSSFSAMNGQIIAFTPHTTNTGACTLNVDGLGAGRIRANSSGDLPSGTLIQGTPYMAFYNATDGSFYLHGFFGNPYSIPLAGGLDYWGSTTPNSSFAFPIGQAISRTTYSTLFSIVGTTYGSGDGSTTFNLPDKTGRVSAMKEASATRLTVAGVGLDGSVLGGAYNGGNAITTANLPPYTPSGSISASASINQDIYSGNAFGTSGSGFILLTGPNGTTNFGTHQATQSVTATFTGTAQGGTSTTFKLIQPTIICNYIMRIL